MSTSAAWRGGQPQKLPAALSRSWSWRALHYKEQGLRGLSTQQPLQVVTFDRIVEPREPTGRGPDIYDRRRRSSATAPTASKPSEAGSGMTVITTDVKSVAVVSCVPGGAGGPIVVPVMLSEPSNRSN